MGSILVRKQSSMQMGMPMQMGGSSMMPMMVIGSQSQEAQPQQFAGVNPQGMAGLSQHPVTGAYQATPIMETKQNEEGEMVQTGNELGSHLGDEYGAQALNQMNQRKLKEGQTRATNYQRGRFNPMRYRSEEKGGGIDTGKTAEQVGFERGAKAGELGDRFGRGLGRAVGVLSGLVSLANAGATGQDALSGGLGAYQTGQFTSDTMQKPLGEGLGGAAARMAGRSVGVQKPKPEVADPTPQVASTTEEPTEEQLVSYRGKEPIMSTNIRDEPVPFQSPMARTRAMRDIHGDSKIFGTRISPANTVEPKVDHMGMPLQEEREGGMVAIDGGPPGLDVGASTQREIAAQQARNVNVAPPTTESTEPTDAEVGKVIGANTVGVKDTEAGKHIKEQTDAAKKTDTTNPSSASSSSSNLKSSNPMRFIGVV
tara:strand:+ start:160 stop:1437 length:1278 start_codon:yes stop_codon:yes gene_type:complete